jgi:hypothetical protein
VNLTFTFKKPTLASSACTDLQSLFPKLGGDSAAVKHWIQTKNTHLKGKPPELMFEDGGTKRITEYLESFANHLDHMLDPVQF